MKFSNERLEIMKARMSQLNEKHPQIVHDVQDQITAYRVARRLIGNDLQAIITSVEANLKASYQPGSRLVSNGFGKIIMPVGPLFTVNQMRAQMGLPPIEKEDDDA